MIHENLYMKGRPLAAPLALFALGLSACTIYIGPYEGDGSAGDIMATSNPNTKDPLDQPARQAEADAYLEQLKLNHRIVACVG